MRWIVLLAACVAPGFSLLGCSGDGATPNCSEAPVYHNRYTADDRTAYGAAGSAPHIQNPKNPSQPDQTNLIKENCVTGADDTGLGQTTSGGTGNTSGGTGNTSGGTGNTSGTAGSGGTTGGTGGTN